MVRKATDANVNELEELYTPLIDAMTYSASATVLAILQGQARLALNRYLDAVAATSNVNASASSSYSSSVGSSLQKRRMDDARASESTALAEFGDALATGGQALPGIGGVVLWDLSGTGL